MKHARGSVTYVGHPTIDPVITSCGHLFCWLCLYKWLQGQTWSCVACGAMLRMDMNTTSIYNGQTWPCLECVIIMRMDLDIPPIYTINSYGSHGMVISLCLISTTDSFPIRVQDNININAK